MNSYKEFMEGKLEYKLYHSSLTNAVAEVEAYVANNGYTLDPEEMAEKVGFGPTKPSEGKTNRYTVTLYKNGKPQRKAVHFQVYNRSKKIALNMELNVYIS